MNADDAATLSEPGRLVSDSGKDPHPHDSLLDRPYIGRFAPSPSGPLHFGSLLAAVASYCDARAHQGQWLVRMEDIDQPRCVAGADRLILETLSRFGFQQDGPVIYQSHEQRQQAYQRALQTLQQENLLFYCTCSRKQLRPCPVYPGTCRSRRTPPAAQDYSIRLQVPDETVGLTDRIQGPYRQNLARDCGDFIVFRKNRLFAYQLAVVVDDADQGITDVVRGIDILDSTPRQIYLQKTLGLPVPRYAHIPVVVDHHGAKLSKQTFAREISHEDPRRMIRLALLALGQSQPPRNLSLEQLWSWAIRHWDIRRIQGQQINGPALGVPA